MFELRNWLECIHRNPDFLPYSLHGSHRAHTLCREDKMGHKHRQNSGSCKTMYTKQVFSHALSGLSETVFAERREKEITPKYCWLV